MEETKQVLIDAQNFVQERYGRILESKGISVEAIAFIAARFYGHQICRTFEPENEIPASLWDKDLPIMLDTEDKGSE